MKTNIIEYFKKKKNTILIAVLSGILISVAFSVPKWIGMAIMFVYTTILEVQMLSEKE